MLPLRALPLALALALPVALPLALPSAAGAAPAAGRVPAPLAEAAQGSGVPGAYIVVLRPGTEPRSVVKGLAVRASHVYEAALQGFSATLTPAQLDRVRLDPAVASVEQDQVVQADATQTMTAGGTLYGLDRTDQKALPLSGSYTYARTGAGVRAYVIDTGISTGHSQFGGRAQNVYDAFGSNGADCNGHGTHVAGTIGATTYGMAKGVSLRGVRVLDCDGSGANSGIIAGIDWVRTHAQKPAVANMSFGGGYSSALNQATSDLSASGVFVAVAAGNSGGSACSSSPASASAATTVAASDKTDTRASFSNYGSCVDTYAPGVSIKSTWLSGGTKTISGTSMASPHVAGVAALYKATYGDASSSTVGSWITGHATAGVIRSNPSGTPNRLLYKAGL